MTRNTGRQKVDASGNAQLAAQYSGTQYNTFIGAEQARKVASLAPPISLPQRRIELSSLHGRKDTLRHLSAISIISEASAEGSGVSPPRKKTPAVVILYGLGGTGKTTVALEVAHRSQSSGRKVWWVPAEESQALESALHAVAFSAGATESDFDRAHPADVLWNALNSTEQEWLLVIDNADDVTSLLVNGRPLRDGTGWLRPPTTPRGRVIVSTRDGRQDRWASWALMEKIEMLTPDDGASVLLDLAPAAGDRDEARALSEALGGLPLALSFAGRYLASTITDPFPTTQTVTAFRSYRVMLEVRLADLLADAEGRLEEVRERGALLTTWELSLDLLSSQGFHLARPVLWLLSCFSARPLPYQAVLQPELLSVHPSFQGVTAQRLGATLKALEGLGLLELGMTQERSARSSLSDSWNRDVALHSLVKSITYENVEKAGLGRRYIHLMITLLDQASHELPPEDGAQWVRWSRLSDHCIEAAHRVSDADEVATAERAIEVAARAAYYQYMSGLYEQSVANYSFLADSAASLLGSHHRITFQVRNMLGRAIREAGRNSEAEESFRNILQSAREVLGEEHPETIKVRINLARTIRERGDSIGAEVEFRDVVSIARRALGGAHSDTLIAILNLARTLRDQGRYEEAWAEYVPVLEVYERQFGERDLTSLDIRFEMAETLRAQGRNSEAEEAFGQLFEVARSIYGDEHPNTLIIRQGWAQALAALGSTERAQDELVEVLRLRRSRLGPEHPLVHETESVLSSISSV